MKSASPPSFLAILFLLLHHATAVTWYYLDYVTPNDQAMLEFSMQMTIPPLPATYINGTYYLWPGLQPSDNSGVYQNVLDGRSGTWWIGTGWCCDNPSLAWGSGFNVYEGDVVTISNAANGSDWTSSLTRNGDASTTVTNSFAVGDKVFNQAIFAIELYTENWDFGSLVFKNAVIKANTTETAWCSDAPSNYNSATTYTLTDVIATANDDGLTSTCTIGEVDMVGPS